MSNYSSEKQYCEVIDC